MVTLSTCAPHSHTANLCAAIPTATVVDLADSYIEWHREKQFRYSALKQLAATVLSSSLRLKTRTRAEDSRKRGATPQTSPAEPQRRGVPTRGSAEEAPDGDAGSRRGSAVDQAGSQHLNKRCSAVLRRVSLIVQRCSACRGSESSADSGAMALGAILSDQARLAQDHETSAAEVRAAAHDGGAPAGAPSATNLTRTRQQAVVEQLHLADEIQLPGGRNTFEMYLCSAYRDIAGATGASLYDEVQLHFAKLGVRITSETLVAGGGTGWDAPRIHLLLLVPGVFSHAAILNEMHELLDRGKARDALIAQRARRSLITRTKTIRALHDEALGLMARDGPASAYDLASARARVSQTASGRGSDPRRSAVGANRPSKGPFNQQHNTHLPNAPTIVALASAQQPFDNYIRSCPADLMAQVRPLYAQIGRASELDATWADLRSLNSSWKPHGPPPPLLMSLDWM